MIDAANKISDIGKKHLKGADLEFFSRVWSGDISIYSARLQALEFSGMEKVLDAGCGFGQWSIAMSHLNSEVYCTDINKVRINTLKDVLKLFPGRKITPSVSSLEETGFRDNYFDAIFCYSCIYFTDYRKSLAEFHRILKPGGKLYVCSNGLGWYLHNLLERHNPSENFDPRKMAIDAIQNTIDYLTNPLERKEGQIIIGSEKMKKFMDEIGFENILIDGEGRINFNKNINIKSFYNPNYHGMEGVFEILAWKK
jgi:ubiquinone/menaquinone biosynthesis C-methylase UbiE